MCINTAEILGTPFQCLASSDERDFEVPGIAVQSKLVPVADWPLTPAQIETLATSTLIAAKLDPATASPRDRQWAIKKATLAACDACYWMPARSEEGRKKVQEAGRSAWLRGELS